MGQKDEADLRTVSTGFFVKLFPAASLSTVSYDN